MAPVQSEEPNDRIYPKWLYRADKPDGVMARSLAQEEALIAQGWSTEYVPGPPAPKPLTPEQIREADHMTIERHEEMIAHLFAEIEELKAAKADSPKPRRAARAAGVEAAPEPAA